jgi:hypothetical protein
MKFPIKKILSNFIIYSTLISQVSTNSDLAPQKLSRDIYKNKSLEEVVREVKTWRQAGEYILTHLKYLDDEKVAYNYPDYMPFKTIHESGFEDCDGGAVAGAALLSDNNRYQCFNMVFSNDSTGIGHAVTLVYDEVTQKFGSLGINKGDIIEPQYSWCDEIAYRINKNAKAQFNMVSIFEFDYSSLIYGKHFVDVIRGNEKEGIISVIYVLDSGKEDKEKFAIFNEPPEEYSSYQNWLEASRDKNLFTKSQADTLIAKTSQAWNTIVARISQSDFEYPYIVDGARGCIQRFQMISKEDN